jgi:hypothetical protein
VEAVEYRQEAMRDLERPEVRDARRDFTGGLGVVRKTARRRTVIRDPVQRNAAH